MSSSEVTESHSRSYYSDIPVHEIAPAARQEIKCNPSSNNSCISTASEPDDSDTKQESDQEDPPFRIAGIHCLACFPLSNNPLNIDACSEEDLNVLAKAELRHATSYLRHCASMFDTDYSSMIEEMEYKESDTSLWPIYIYTSSGYYDSCGINYQPAFMVRRRRVSDAINEALRSGGFQQLKHYLFLLQRCLQMDKSAHLPMSFPCLTVWRGVTACMSKQTLFECFPLEGEIAFPGLTSTCTDARTAAHYLQRNSDKTVEVATSAALLNMEGLDRANLCDIPISWILFEITIPRPNEADAYWVGELSMSGSLEVLILPMVPMRVTRVCSENGGQGAKICLSVIGNSSLKFSSSVWPE